MNIKQSLVLFSSLFFSLSAMSASKWLGDWFEVEVILISQLDDKAKLKEVFSDQEFTLDHSKTLDLLTPYLNPDIATLKQQLPLCDEIYDERNYLEQATIWPKFHLNKTLLTLSQEQQQALAEELALLQESYAQEKNIEEENVQENGVNQTSAISNEIPTQPGDNDDFFDRIQTKQEQNSNLPDTQALNEDETAIKEASLVDESVLTLTALTEEQKSLVIKAEQTFSDIKFSYHSTYPKHAKSLDNKSKATSFCHITKQQFEQLEVNENLYSYNGFLVNKMPNTISNAESIYSEIPYLISEDSLQLKDIVRQLRRSKDFRPLLHLAWRQPVFEKEDSKPMRIFAGDNIQGQYAKNLATYQTEKNTALEEEKTLNTIFALSGNSLDDQNDFTEQSITNKPSPEATLEQIKSERINGILEQISNVNDIEEVVALLSDNSQSLPSLNQLHHKSMIANEPTPPLQPWYVEGLMDVYLIGNYLHVANDFSILNMTLTEQESLKLKTSIVGNTVNVGDVINTSKVIPIRMTQNRRMISREVHYFDHPYMGIIIQIRRHQRPELTTELTSENANDENDI